MDLRKVLKKLGFSENFTSSRRVFSGFSLGVGVSLLVLSVFFLYYSPPFKGFVFQSPLVGSWHFSFSSGGEKIHSGKGNVTEGSGFEEKTHCGNLSENGKNASFWGSTAGKGVLERIQSDKNGSFMGLQAGSLHKSSEKGILVGNPKVKSTERDGNQSFVGYGDMGLDINGTGKASGRGESVRSGGKEEDVVKGSKEVPSVRGDGNGSFTGETGGFAKRDSESNIAGNVSNSIGREKGHEGNSTEGGKLASSFNESGVGDAIKCDIFDGRWVRDEGKPYYPAGSCPHIDRDFDCYLNGRPDSDFVKWRWQPNHCDIPSLNATDFLERLRGKKLIFVGDSLNRNMWESLVCILRHSLADKKKVYEISGRKEFKKKGFYAFRYEDYNCTIDFVSSTFLVRESSYKSRNGSVETLRLDLMDRTTSMYQDADIIVFNTGHWWTHEKTSKGENYYQEGNHVYPRLKVMEAYKKALTTWARWIDKNIDAKKTQVYYRGYSVTHFRGGQWNSGGQCDKETEPIFNDSYLAKYPSKMKVLEHVLAQMNTPVVYMNISKLTDYRKDAHPSIYRKEYKTEEEKIAAESSQDCSHWCLPGIPDTWNELLYASILRYSERLLRH